MCSLFAMALQKQVYKSNIVVGDHRPNWTQQFLWPTMTTKVGSLAHVLSTHKKPLYVLYESRLCGSTSVDSIELVWICAHTSMSLSQNCRNNCQRGRKQLYFTMALSNLLAFYSTFAIIFVLLSFERRDSAQSATSNLFLLFYALNIFVFKFVSLNF